MSITAADHTLVHVSTGNIARWLVAAGDIPIVRSKRVVDRGVPADDRYVEAYWLCHLGALGFVTLRRLDALARCTDIAGEPFTTSIVKLCAEEGVSAGGGGGPAGFVTRALARLIHPFGLVDLVGGQLAVPALVPFLNADQVCRLPDHIRPSHRLWERAVAGVTQPYGVGVMG